VTDGCNVALDREMLESSALAKEVVRAFSRLKAEGTELGREWRKRL
jgi:hypothetical protein